MVKIFKSHMFSSIATIIQGEKFLEIIIFVNIWFNIFSSRYKYVFVYLREDFLIDTLIKSNNVFQGRSSFYEKMETLEQKYYFLFQVRMLR
jgi:hypothetical protein